MSITERAKQYADRYLGTEVLWKLAYNRYIEIATEQDQITRQEERERCIDIAKEHVCSMCGYSECEFGTCSQYNSIEQCDAIINLCKAIKDE